MVDVWFAKDGDSPTQGEFPNYILSLGDCIKKLGLTEEDFLTDLSKVPKFGKRDDPLAVIRGNQHVIIMVAENEAAHLGGRPGFYRSPVSPEEAANRLGPSTSL